MIETTAANGRTTIFDIFTAYETRRAVFTNLTAYETAKLDVSLSTDSRGPFLGQWEREIFLNPVRDILSSTLETKWLCSEGLQLVLIGADLPILKRRLSQTEEHGRKHGYQRRLQIYAIGMFPLAKIGFETQNRVLQYSLHGRYSTLRAFRDKYHLLRMQKEKEFNPLANATFLLAFGVPMDPYNEGIKGRWQRLSEVPEQTIDLMVYVPSLQDRLLGEVRLTLSDLPKLCGLASARSLSAMLKFGPMVIGMSRIMRAWLTYAGVRPIPQKSDTDIEQKIEAEIFVRLGVFVVGSLPYVEGMLI